MKTRLHFTKPTPLPVSFETNDTTGQRRCSTQVFKSITTKALPEGTCNVPVNMPEKMREEIDRVMGETSNIQHSTFNIQFGKPSRNAFLLAVIVSGIRSASAAAAEKLETILKAAGRPVLNWFRRADQVKDDREFASLV